jgi:predicted nucleotidyltransferase component of viral defense system
MPEVGQMLRALVKERGIQLEILEKDYALSYLLVAMAETQGLGDKIALKGGTALRKLYYPGYRFSEDLDYSTLHLGPLADIAQTMERAVQRMTALLQERGPFSVQLEPLVLPLPHPGQQAAFLARVQFPYHRQPLCRLKVEITTDEPVLLPVEHRPVLHDFNEPLAMTVGVYSLGEIVAEKLRALLQVQEKLAERGWGASRVCRDYYDLWSVLQREGRMDGQIPDLLAQKCTVRHVTFTGPQDFTSPDLLGVARKEWPQQLLPFVPGAPPVELVLSEVQPLIFALWE